MKNKKCNKLSNTLACDVVLRSIEVRINKNHPSDNKIAEQKIHEMKKNIFNRVKRNIEPLMVYKFKNKINCI